MKTYSVIYKNDLPVGVALQEIQQALPEVWTLPETDAFVTADGSEYPTIPTGIWDVRSLYNLLKQTVVNLGE